MLPRGTRGLVLVFFLTILRSSRLALAFLPFSSGRLLAFAGERGIVHKPPPLAAASREQTKMMGDGIDSKVVVRTADGEENMTIMLNILGKLRTLRRPKDEPLSKTLFRIRQSAKPPNKGSKKKKVAEGFGAQGNTGIGAPSPAAEVLQEDEPVVALRHDGDVHVEEEMLNSEAWMHGSVLRVGDDLLTVEVNPPGVETLKLPVSPVVGVPQTPFVSIIDAEAAESCWEWERGRTAKDGGVVQWEAASCSSQMYVPTDEDVGCVLRVTCKPRRRRSDGGKGTHINGEGMTSIPTEPVQNGPKIWAGDGRHDVTSEKTPAGRLRVVCYNLLASVYVDGRNAKKTLFGYVDEAYLSTEWRRQLQLHEIMGFNSDILCLQEVDYRLYEQYLEPHMMCLGYGGAYLSKSCGVREGEAIFWRRDKYELVNSKDVVMQECFSEASTQSGQLHECFAPLLESSPELASIVRTKLSTVVQIALLRPIAPAHNEGMVLLANTHLFFHPGASHIRIMQAAAIMNEVSRAAKEWVNDGDDFGVVVCGDLNSEPDTGAIELLAKGHVSKDHREWKEYAGFSWGGQKAGGEEGGEEQDMEGGSSAALDSEKVGEGISTVGIDISHGWELASACDLKTSFTNYVRGYIGCLDYILYQSGRLRLAGTSPLPDECQVQETALPSDRYPSDHVSLCYDFEWNDPGLGSHLTQDERYPAGLAERLRLPVPASRHLVGKGHAALESGGMVALPTDTVYGLATALSPNSVSLIREARRAGMSQPLAICVGHVKDIEEYAEVGNLPEGLLDSLLPGPITVVLRRKFGQELGLSSSFNGGSETIAIRVPGDDVNARPGFSFCRELAKRSEGRALVLTSVDSACTVDTNQFREIWQNCSVVFDGGTLPAGSESTVVDMSRDESRQFKIVREGGAKGQVLDVMQHYGFTLFSSQQ